MAYLSFALCTLAVSPALAQSVVIIPRAQGEVRFNLVADSPSLKPNLFQGSSSTTRIAGGPATIGHRFFYDETAHDYFGYDFVIQLEPTSGSYLLSFHDLSIGPLDFPNGSRDSLDPSLWKKLTIPPLPAPTVVKTGDVVPVRVFVNPDNGRTLVDNLTVPLTPVSTRTVGPNGPMLLSQMRTVMMQTAMAPSLRPPEPVTGPAREYSVEDVELRIQPMRVSVNGGASGGVGRSRGASGSLVWLYVPDHGRYVLSLAPRPDLGFTKAGEVRGNVVTFTIGKDRVEIESGSMAVVGDAAYVLYVLHDAEWAPTAQGQGGAVLCGSVSPREIAALMRK
jgi:hypothetical protein